MVKFLIRNVCDSSFFSNHLTGIPRIKFHPVCSLRKCTDPFLIMNVHTVPRSTPNWPKIWCVLCSDVAASGRRSDECGIHMYLVVHIGPRSVQSFVHFSSAYARGIVPFRRNRAVFVPRSGVVGIFYGILAIWQNTSVVIVFYLIMIALCWVRNLFLT